MSVARHLHQMCFVHMIFYTEMATKGNQGSSDICVCVCVCVCCVVVLCKGCVCVYLHTHPCSLHTSLLLYHTTLHSRASTGILRVSDVGPACQLPHYHQLLTQVCHAQATEIGEETTIESLFVQHWLPFGIQTIPY